MSVSTSRLGIVASPQLLEFSDEELAAPFNNVRDCVVLGEDTTGDFRLILVRSLCKSVVKV